MCPARACAFAVSVLHCRERGRSGGTSGGLGGSGGGGETELQLQRRRIRTRIATLNRQLAEVLTPLLHNAAKGRDHQSCKGIDKSWNPVWTFCKTGSFPI